MRNILLAPVIALGACAAAPHHAQSPSLYSESFDVDPQSIVPMVYAATDAQHYRVAMVDPRIDRTRFVMLPNDGGAPLVVYVAPGSARRDRFMSCVGSCASAVEVTPMAGGGEQAQALL